MLDRILDSSTGFIFEASSLLLVLVLLEAVLSADNAIALAAIARGLENPQVQRRALNIGLLFAYVLRVTLILTATWATQFWQLELLGAAYLLWLVFRYYASPPEEGDENSESHSSARFHSLLQAIPVIAFTDLAFSLDSVTTAIAISDRLWLIVAGGTIGVLALRFLAGLFVRWLSEFIHLEDAGYITVGYVGVRLLMRVATPEVVPPEWFTVLFVGLVFWWGFSQRVELVEVADSSLEIGDRAPNPPETVGSSRQQ